MEYIIKKVEIFILKNIIRQIVTKHKNIRLEKRGDYSKIYDEIKVAVFETKIIYRDLNVKNECDII